MEFADKYDSARKGATGRNVAMLVSVQDDGPQARDLLAAAEWLRRQCCRLLASEHGSRARLPGWRTTVVRLDKHCASISECVDFVVLVRVIDGVCRTA